MDESPYTLSDKTILVTGASSGIGKATAVACSRLGAKLIITGRDEARLNQTLYVLAGGEHTLVKCDLTKEDEIQNLVNHIEKLDGIVYCAGTQQTCIAKMLNRDVIQNLMNTNFLSTVMLNAALLSRKKVNKGASIVFVSSAAVSHVSEVGNAAYSASKGALSSFGRVLATELAPRKIRVNMVAPAMVRTAIMEKFDVSEEEFIENEKMYPLGYGEPEDIANTIAFLLSDAARWITGTELLLDGGLTLH